MSQPPVREHGPEAVIGQGLERRYRERRAPDLVKELEHGGHVLHAEEKHIELAGELGELESCLGDHAERALATDEKVLEIRAGVVFLESAIELEDVAVHRDDLKSEHPL